MQQDYWHQRWNSHNVGFNQDKPNPYLVEYLQKLQLQPGDSIFVPLCGKSIDMLYLLQQGYKVIGVELSDIACAEFFNDNNIAVAKEKQHHFTIYHHDDITLYCGDFFQLPDDIFSDIKAVYDRAALVALPEDMRKAYVEFFCQHLQTNTTMLLCTMSYEQTQMPGPPFAINEAMISAYYQQRADIEVLSHEPIEHIAKHLQAKGLQQAFNEVFLLQFR